MTPSFLTWLNNWKTFVSFNYLKDRTDINFIISVIQQTLFEKKHPVHPWITIAMTKALYNLLKESDVGFEYGSGNSTVWFAKHTKHITSVETDRNWKNKVIEMLEKYNFKNKAKIIYVENVEESKSKGKKEYVDSIGIVKDKSLDYCMIDAFYRDECILRAIPKLKSGGLLIVDNVDNYFPKNVISVSVRYKRDNQSKAVSVKKMNKIYKMLSTWRCLWTSSGVQDTALWIKP